jgi:formyl-CoA transferase
LGQDTDDVLRELGISPAQISELKRRGIIAASD